MCWSKRSPDNEDSGPTTTTTTRKPMALKCPGVLIPCDEKDKDYCFYKGLCCHEPNETNKSCVCHTDYMGHYCQDRKPEYSKEMYERAQAIVAFSAVLGVIVITLFVVLIVLQIKYYHRRKKRQRKEGHHEMDVIPGENGKGSKRRLTTQPGYSWRESFRRAHSKASEKFKSTLSRSVPEDLFQVGLKMAVFGGWKPNHGPIDQQSVAIKAEVKAGTTQRCFSADPKVGDSSHQTAFDVRDPVNVSDRPSVIQMPAATAPAEDTVK